MDDRTRRLLTAPLVPTLARMAAPYILVMAVQTSVGLIETYFVSMLGTDALAGMALVFPVVMLVQMLSAGGMGGAIQSAVSRTLGADRRADAGILAWHTTALGLGLGLFGDDPAMVATGSPSTSRPRAPVASAGRSPPACFGWGWHWAGLGLRLRSDSGWAVLSSPYRPGSLSWASSTPPLSRRTACFRACPATDRPRYPFPLRLPPVRSRAVDHAA